MLVITPTQVAANSGSDVIESSSAGAGRHQGWQCLVEWQARNAELAFVYARSLGGLMQTGRCRIFRLSEVSVTLEAAGSKLLIVLVGAKYDVGPQQFFSADFLSRFDVQGVAVRLANFDWLFLAEGSVPEDASPAVEAQRALPG